MIDPKRDFIPLTQNYDRLKAYQKSECIYDTPIRDKIAISCM